MNSFKDFGVGDSKTRAAGTRETRDFKARPLARISDTSRRARRAPNTGPPWVVERLRSKRSRMIATVQCEFTRILRVLLIIKLTFCHRTFLKRKGGLFKKAHELAVLCSVDVAVIIFGHNKKLYEYSSCDMHEALGRYQYVSPFVDRTSYVERLAKIFSVSSAHPMSTKDPMTLPASATTTTMKMR